MTGEKERLQDRATKNDGDGYININGNIEPAFKISSMEMSVEMLTQQKRFLNQTTEQSAVRGMKISGKVSFYSATNALIKAIEEYKNGGKYPDITLQGWAKIDNQNRSEILLTDVILNKLTLLGIEENSNDDRVYESDISANDFQIIQ